MNNSIYVIKFNCLNNYKQCTLDNPRANYPLPSTESSTYIIYHMTYMYLKNIYQYIFTLYIYTLLLV